MKNTIIKDTIILTLITLVSGGLLGLVYQVTKETYCPAGRDGKTGGISGCL